MKVGANKATNNSFDVVILGGGTAGWMAANIMAKRWLSLDINITLVESLEIGSIGVGEGSTPQLKGFFDFIGIDESDWMPRCHATYKNGITFKGWSSRPGYDSYFHPFPAATDAHAAQAFVYNCYLRRNHIDIDTHPDKYFLPAYLAKEGLGPKPDYNFPFFVSYGYHFDSRCIGDLLKNHGKKNGIIYRQAKICEVIKSPNGNIDYVLTEDGDAISADFFVDATGFSGLLIQKTLKVPFVSFKQNLFNDSAVVLSTENAEGPNSHTVSSAMKYGWRWDIPLTNRSGSGYVYSSDFCSHDDAETELRKSLGLLDSAVSARHINMRVGRVEKHWYRNCLAVGLSQGFIEPLEATALHLVQETVDQFIDLFEQGNFSNKLESQFNKIINDRFEGIRDYIVCHYHINSRKDTDYWKENAENQHISDSLRHILSTWVGGQDLTRELHRQDIEKYYTSISWHCMLSGYGFYPNHTLKKDEKRASRFSSEHIGDFHSRCALNFKHHSVQLSALH